MEEKEDKDAVNSPDLKNFVLTKILSNDAARKKILLLGSFPESENPESKMILIIEKIEFTEDNFTTEDEQNAILKHILTVPEMVNDIYADFTATVDGRLNKLKVTTIYPATDAHVKKYSYQEFVTIDETPEIYEKVTLPFMKSKQFSIDWVYNILEGKKEADRTDYKDEDPKTGFLLARDLKWSGQVESLHMTAIVYDRSIKSLRDLNASHLPLLKNIRTKSFETIKSKYGLDESKIRAYFHYQPSYYHLHVHFTNLSFDSPGTQCDRGHLLSTVISNIELLPDYYQKATIPFVTGKDFGLYQAILEAKDQN